MQSFTEYKSLEVDKRIQSNLNLIRNILVSNFGEKIAALILVGGFGRGEGGVLIADNQIIVSNDYDIEMIVNSNVDEAKVKQLSMSLARELKIKWVDIAIRTTSRLKWLKGTQYGFDLKYGGRILFGDSSIFQKIPATKPDELSPREIEVLLFTRIWCFLGPVKEGFLNSQLTREEKYFLFEQLSKAILAIEEAWLIFSGKYVSSYRKKLENFKEVVRDPKLLKFAGWATEFKLKPSFGYLPSQPVKFYFEVKRAFMDQMLLLINKSYEKRFNSWEQYIRWYPKRIDTLVRRVGAFVIRRNLKYEKKLHLGMTQLALVNAFQQSGIDMSQLRLARQFLLRIQRGCVPAADGKDLFTYWRELTKISLEVHETYGK